MSKLHVEEFLNNHSYDSLNFFFDIDTTILNLLEQVIQKCENTLGFETEQDLMEIENDYSLVCFTFDPQYSPSLKTNIKVKDLDEKVKKCKNLISQIKTNLEKNKKETEDPNNEIKKRVNDYESLLFESYQNYLEKIKSNKPSYDMGLIERLEFKFESVSNEMIINNKKNYLEGLKKRIQKYEDFLFLVYKFSSDEIKKEKNVALFYNLINRLDSLLTKFKNEKKMLEIQITQKQK